MLIVSVELAFAADVIKTLVPLAVCVVRAAVPTALYKGNPPVVVVPVAVELAAVLAVP
jgi:hypothetical protein